MSQLGLRGSVHWGVQGNQYPFWNWQIRHWKNHPFVTELYLLVEKRHHGWSNISVLFPSLFPENGFGAVSVLILCPFVCWLGVGEESACWWQEDICRAEEKAAMKCRKTRTATSPCTSARAVSLVSNGTHVWTLLGVQQCVSGAVESMETVVGELRFRSSLQGSFRQVT